MNFSGARSVLGSFPLWSFGSIVAIVDCPIATCLRSVRCPFRFRVPRSVRSVDLIDVLYSLEFSTSSLFFRLGRRKFVLPVFVGFEGLSLRSDFPSSVGAPTKKVCPWNSAGSVVAYRCWLVWPLLPPDGCPLGCVRDALGTLELACLAP